MATSTGDPPIRTIRELGAALRHAREQRKWTQSELASRARVGRQWLSAMERGTHDRAEIGKILAVISELGYEITLTPPPPRADLDLGEHLQRYLPQAGVLAGYQSRPSGDQPS